MRAFSSLAIVIFIFLVGGCSNIDDGALSKRNSSIHVFEGPLNYTSTDVIEVADGFVLLGSMAVTDDSILTVVIKTDKYGNLKGSHQRIPGGEGKSIKPFTNDSFSGYLILGDRIKIDPFAGEVGNIEIVSARILALNQNLEMVGSATIKDTLPSTPARPVLTDFRGSALTTTTDGRVVLLATFKKTVDDVVEPEKPLIIVLKNSLSFDSSDPYKMIKASDVDWANPFTVVDKDFINAKSIHYFENRIIWASSILKETGSFSDSYVALPYLEEPLSYINFDQLGNNLPNPKQFTVTDIQPSHNVAFGFGVVGTYAETDGTKKNMFFSKVDYSGTFQDTLFIDASMGKTTNPDLSDIDDTGESLTSTYDGGFVLAGTLASASVGTKTIGNGLRDIFLVKVNFAGAIQWTKIIGGGGDEVVSRIRETSDHGLVITGTNTIGGYSSIFLIKTDMNGELIK